MESNPSASDPRYTEEKKYDILYNGTNAFAIWFRFRSDGTLESNQTMFNKCKFNITNANEFELPRKNGSKVLWRWSS